ncbi:MAG TPA: helix-turn-helix transcriptional regulator [Polyangiaceae bacterium]|jgi:transcriptional regulator with XRE-family HTH domain
MTTASSYRPEKRHAKLTPGRALQIARELQAVSQSELARRTGIAQSAISAFESGTQEMGLKRIKVLAKALAVHPAVIAFPDYTPPQARRVVAKRPSSTSAARPMKRAG